MLISAGGVAAAGLSAALLVLLLSPTAIRFAKARNVLDHPDSARKRQLEPTPIAGGTLIFSIFIGLTGLGTFLLPREDGQIALWLSIVIPASIVFFVGLYDDLFTSSPTKRLLLQTAAALLSSILILNSETHIRLFANNFVNQALGVIWIVTLTNAFNFIDNMDGHSLTVGSIAAAALTVIAGGNGQWLIAASTAIIGASAGSLLRWNWQPARVYLGDGGALFIGFLLATLALRIELTDQQEWISVAIPVIVFSIPLIDILIAVIGRLQRRVSPLTAGRDHLSHRLVKGGMTVKGSVSTLSATALGCGAVGILLASANPTSALIILISYGVLVLVAIAFVLTKTEPL